MGMLSQRFPLQLHISILMSFDCVLERWAIEHVWHLQIWMAWQKERKIVLRGLGVLVISRYVMLNVLDERVVSIFFLITTWCYAVVQLVPLFCT
jgi:hypothetical protein